MKARNVNNMLGSNGAHTPQMLSYLSKSFKTIHTNMTVYKHGNFNGYDYFIKKFFLKSLLAIVSFSFLVKCELKFEKDHLNGLSICILYFSYFDF